MEQPLSLLENIALWAFVIAYFVLPIIFAAKVFSQVGTSGYTALLLLVPLANIVALVMLVMAVKRILDEYGRPWTWLVLLFIPYANIIFLGLVAYKRFPHDKLTPTEDITWIKRIKH